MSTVVFRWNNYETCRACPRAGVHFARVHAAWLQQKQNMQNMLTHRHMCAAKCNLVCGQMLEVPKNTVANDIVWGVAGA